MYFLALFKRKRSTATPRTTELRTRHHALVDSRPLSQKASLLPATVWQLCAITVNFMYVCSPEGATRREIFLLEQQKQSKTHTHAHAQALLACSRACVCV